MVNYGGKVTGPLAVTDASGNALIVSSDGTATAQGAIVGHVAGGDTWLGIYDPSVPAYYGISMELPSQPGTATAGGYYNGLGIGGFSQNSGQPIFGILNSGQSGNGLGNTCMTVYDNKTVVTFHNTLDDGAGNLAVGTAGTGLRVKEGSNAKQGTAALAGGAAVVANTSVTATSRIFLTSQADGGTPGWLRVSARTAGTSFTITSSSGTDTSTVAYQIFEPA